jgi:hypothetical protein
MEDQFYSLDADQRILLVREAIATGRPLMIRWEEIRSDFGDRWQHRASVAAEWLAQVSSVVDLGCGTMNLERCLRSGQVYIPVDLARRDERTRIADLNRPADLARLPTANACALLGVLEYIYSPHQLVRSLHGKYRQLVVSFNILCSEQSYEARIADGWVNHFTHEEILALFADHGFSLRRELLFEGKRREYLFDLCDTDSLPNENRT